jgi:hypothetical protein
VFLDTLGFSALPVQAQNEFGKRYPHGSYDQNQADFLSKLRQVLGAQAVIFTNQGYRRAELFLPHADFDLVENSFTQLDEHGNTKLRSWFQKGSEWEGIEIPITNLIAPAARLFPRTQFVHFNYAHGDPAFLARAVRYSYACAKLWNQISFTARPGVQKPIRDNIYFTNLGEPLTPSYDEDKSAEVAWRRFQNGAVAVNSSHTPYHLRTLRLTLRDPPRGYVITSKQD